VRVALFVSRHSYRAGAFLDATRALGVEAVVVTDHRSPIEGEGLVHIAELDRLGGIDGVVAADDWGVPHAARLAERVGLIGSGAEAVEATLDKRVLRTRLAAAGLRQPHQNPERGPWIVKPVDRSAGEGVVLVNSVDERDRAVDAARVRYGHEPLVESFIEGPEVVIEGIVVDGVLRVMASFDKPGERTGPTFPETMLVAPSLHEPEAAAVAARACVASQLRQGPVHIEVVMSVDGPVVLEVHARSIGGLCSGVVATEPSLEQLIVTAALGQPLAFTRTPGATGVFMLPVPAAGRLLAVDGIDEACAVAGITGVDITALGQDVVPLPERGEYIGFVYASAPTTFAVERALREAVEWLCPRVASTGSA
jgi:predicted ATP-grasp superfamily ATP-dependent carboligase